MPFYARKEIVREGEVGVYHTWSRCVQKACLCGLDPETGIDFDDRLVRIKARMADSFEDSPCAAIQDRLQAWRKEEAQASVEAFHAEERDDFSLEVGEAERLLADRFLADRFLASIGHRNLRCKIVFRSDREIRALVSAGRRPCRPTCRAAGNPPLHGIRPCRQVFT